MGPWQIPWALGNAVSTSPEYKQLRGINTKRRLAAQREKPVRSNLNITVKSNYGPRKLVLKLVLNSCLYMY